MTIYLSLRKEARVVKEEPAVYKEEIENLTKQISDKYYNLEEIVDKVHKANAEEEADVRVLNSYIANQEETYGSLIKRVQKIYHKNKVFKALEIEAEEIKDQGNINAYKKQ